MNASIYVLFAYLQCVVFRLQAQAQGAELPAVQDAAPGSVRRWRHHLRRRPHQPPPHAPPPQCRHAHAHRGTSPSQTIMAKYLHL